MHSIRRYDWTLHLATIAFCSYFLAKAVTTYFAGMLESLPETEIRTQTEESSQSSPSVAQEGKEGEEILEGYQVILDRNIFNSAESAVIEKEIPPENTDPNQLDDLGPAVKTSLAIKVLGTLVIGEGTDRRSSATISGGKSKESEVYSPGDAESFEPNVKLTKVAKDRIEFVHSGRLEYAELEDFASKKSIFAAAEEVHGKDAPAMGKKEKERGETPAAESGKIVLDQKEIDEALQNLDKLSSEVRIIPNFKEGRPAGMKVLSVKPGSVASKLGIRRGDILERVNGQDLDIKQGLELFSSMKDMKSFSLDVVRGGKNQTLEYEIR